MEAQDKLQVILLGTTGCGKSASGNSILGKKVFKSYASTQSVTVSYQSATASISGMEVTVVDTPGWHCTKISEKEVESEIKTAITSVNGPYSFLVVIPIGSYTAKEMQMISKLRKILGEEFMNHTTILFSHGDNLESKSFDQFLMEEKGLLHDIVQCCGHRVHPWNNKDVSSVGNIQDLLQNLKKTQIMTNSMKHSQRKMLTEEIKPEQNLMTFDHMPESSDAHLKRCKKDTTELPDNSCNSEVRVVVLGMAGVGKTSVIQKILGNHIQTKKSKSTVYTTNRLGKKFKFIDSQGFKDVKEVKEIVSCSLSIATPGPHVIMLVIEVGKVNTKTFETTEYIHGCLCDNAITHTLILFTVKDKLEDRAIEEFIENSPELENIVKMHGDRFHALSNYDCDQAQVNQLLEKILKIYEENNCNFIKEQMKRSDHMEERRKPEEPCNQEPFVGLNEVPQ